MNRFDKDLRDSLGLEQPPDGFADRVLERAKDLPATDELPLIQRGKGLRPAEWIGIAALVLVGLVAPYLLWQSRHDAVPVIVHPATVPIPAQDPGKVSSPAENNFVNNRTERPRLAGAQESSKSGGSPEQLGRNAQLPGSADARVQFDSGNAAISAGNGTPGVHPPKESNFAAPGFAQSSGLVAGKVVGLRGDPIPGAHIRLERTDGPPFKVEVKTDTKGQYLVKIPAGQYKVSYVKDDKPIDSVDGVVSSTRTFEANFVDRGP